MGFGEAVRTCFSKYVDFSGRAIRSEYWYFALALLIGTIVAGILDGVIGSQIGIIGLIFSLATLLPSLAAGVRRLHDLDRTGWWMLIGLVPLIGMIVLLVFFVQRGTAGPNRFGEDPLGGVDVAAFE